MNRHLDPYGFMIPEIFPSAEADSPLNLVSSCPCEFWFDGQDASTFTLNGVNVIQQDDKSGFARHISNAVDARRPSYDVATGRVSFVAANNDYLQSAAFIAALAQPNTIFVVYKKTGSLANVEVVFSGADAIDFEIFYSNMNKFVMEAPTTLQSSGANNANDNIHVGLFNGASSEYWINGVLGVTGNAGTNALGGITLGASFLLANFADVDIMEVIVFNADISDVDRDIITGYLANKWDITATTTHKGYVLTTE